MKIEFLTVLESKNQKLLALGKSQEGWIFLETPALSGCRGWLQSSACCLSPVFKKHHYNPESHGLPCDSDLDPCTPSWKDSFDYSGQDNAGKPPHHESNNLITSKGRLVSSAGRFTGPQGEDSAHPSSNLSSCCITDQGHLPPSLVICPTQVRTAETLPWSQSKASGIIA